MNAHWARPVDVDGDGVPETVAPDQQGGLLVIRSDGTEAQRIRLRGAANSHISGFAIVRGSADEEPGWLVARTVWSRFGGSSSTTVALHSADGTALWTYAPELPKEVTCQCSIATTDLTGDGTPEMIVVMGTYRMKRISDNTFEHDKPEAYLIILDSEGQVLAQRRAGRDAQLLHTVPAASGSPGAVLVVADGKLRRYTLDANAAVTPAKPE